MNQVIHLDLKDVPEMLRRGYTGRKFKAVVCTHVDIPQTAGMWDGGSREDYVAMVISTGNTIGIGYVGMPPWSLERVDAGIVLKPGLLIREHSTFCGKDAGLTFYVHPDNAAKLIPAGTVELDACQKCVLNIIQSYKSAYRDEYYRHANLRDDQIAQIKKSLFVLGLTNAAGAITVKGRNALAGSK